MTSEREGWEMPMAPRVRTGREVLSLVMAGAGLVAAGALEVAVGTAFALPWVVTAMAVALTGVLGGSWLARLQR
jgi:hypothetical protein